MNKPLADAIAWAEGRTDFLRLSNGHLLTEGQHLQALLAAARGQVPREPTSKMVDAGVARLIATIGGDRYTGYDHEAITQIFHAMYDAAPINTESR
jgi:hypothetical protein